MTAFEIFIFPKNFTSVENFYYFIKFDEIEHENGLYWKWDLSYQLSHLLTYIIYWPIGPQLSHLFPGIPIAIIWLLNFSYLKYCL